MRTVHKYPLTGEVTDFEAPVGGKVVHVGNDPLGTPSVWLEVDTVNYSVSRRFVLAGTGQAVPANGEHKGSFIQGPFIWHVYEVRS